VKRRRRERRRISPFAAALIAIALIAIPSYLAIAGGVPWKHQHLIKAVVRSGNELQARSPVRIAGVTVGEVQGIERGPGSTAIVTMSIGDAGLPIHRDATLKVRPRLFLEGNFFLDLHPGTPTSPNLPEGGTIPLSQTATPVQLDQVLTALGSNTRTDLKSFLRGLSQSLDKGGAKHFSRVVPLMEPAFLESAIATDALRGQRPGDLTGLIADGERTARALSSRSTELPQLVGALDVTLTTLAQRRAAFGQSLTKLNDIAGHAPATFVALDRLFPTLRAISIEARPGLRAAPATLDLANPLLVQARALVSRPELPALLGQLDPAVRTLSALEPRLQRLFGTLQPITECVRRNAIPMLKHSIVDPPLTTGLPIYREILDSTVGLASGSQDFTGDGPAVRYHAGFGDQIVTTGTAPSLGEPLVGLTSEPLLGSRPRYTGQRPPFRPSVPCISQQPPDLAAQTGPAPQQRTAP
jgi:phospholipid/cholesterol/gamma-HCH transport system substrate-binding protein